MTTTATTSPAMTATAARATGVTKAYGMGDARVLALDNVDVAIEAGRFTAIMGPSGSGKSTLLHVLAGLDRPSEGQITIGDADITKMNDKQLTLLRRDRIGFIFQSFNLLPTLTAAENIALPSKIAGRSQIPSGCSPSSRPSASGTASRTGRRSCPVASNSASLRRGLSRASRTSCSPTSRPVRSTRGRARSCCDSCSTPFAR